MTPFLTIWNVLLVLLHHHTSVCLKMYRIPLLKTLHTQASRNILEEWKSSEVKWLAIATLISVSKHTHTFSPSHTHTQPREHSGECSPVAMGTRSPLMPLCHTRTHTQRGAVCSSPWPISLATVISPQSGLHYSLDSLLVDGQVSCPIHSWPYQHGEEGHSVNTGLGFM